MIYTSYFGKLKKMPENFHTIAICQYPPKWYDKAVYKKLAPTPNILNTYKKHVNENPQYWEDWYNEQYKKEVLDTLPSSNALLRQLISLFPQGEWLNMSRNCGETPIWNSLNEHIVLLCFEKDGDFCHRKLVSDWLNEKGIPCREANDGDFINQKEQEEIEME